MADGSAYMAPGGGATKSTQDGGDGAPVGAIGKMDLGGGGGYQREEYAFGSSSGGSSAGGSSTPDQNNNPAGSGTPGVTKPRADVSCYLGPK